MFSICLSFILLISCSENQVSPPPATILMSDYFPSTPGSWWLYQNYSVDSLGTKTKTWTDSVFVIEPKIIDGKQAIVMVRVNFIDNEWDADTIYFHIDGSKLYTYMDSPLNEGKFVWKVYVDLSNENWQVIRDEFHVDSMFYDPYSNDSSQMKTDVIYEILGNQIQDSIVKVKGDNYSARGFKLSMMISGYHLEFGEEYTDIQADDAYFWFVKKIGRVNLFIENVYNKNNKDEQELIDYYINE
ncbi:MAG: hypothetical protein V1779_13455 [bacterium]